MTRDSLTDKTAVFRLTTHTYPTPKCDPTHQAPREAEEETRESPKRKNTKHNATATLRILPSIVPRRAGRHDGDLIAAYVPRGHPKGYSLEGVVRQGDLGPLAAYVPPPGGVYEYKKTYETYLEHETCRGQV